MTLVKFLLKPSALKFALIYIPTVVTILLLDLNFTIFRREILGDRLVETVDFLELIRIEIGVSCLLYPMSLATPKQLIVYVKEEIYQNLLIYCVLDCYWALLAIQKNKYHRLL